MIKSPKAMDEAIYIAGGVARLGEVLGVAHTSVVRWRKSGRVPADRVLAVEAATGVARHRLRPDLFEAAPPAGFAEAQAPFAAEAQSLGLGIAVAIEDGLITPIVRDADAKGLSEIAQEIRELAERAKRKALKPEEYTGGSITVSNLGMFGIDSFIGVINPPQCAILAIGKVGPKVVVRDDAMVIRQMMSITLSGDHRVIDGAVGAQYLQELRSLLEHPLRLLF